MSLVYPAPKVRWYAAAQEHPSIRFGQTTLGFEPPPEAPKEDKRPVEKINIGGASGCLTISVDTATELDFGEACYYATAYYQGEAETLKEQRRTKPQKARASAGDPGKYECTIGKDIALPFNSRQQFMKVALFRVDREGDKLVGEATAPIADERAESMSSWPLMQDFEEQGLVRFKVQLPSDDSPPVTPVQKTKDGGRQLTVSVDKATELERSPDGAYYYVTAYYQGEPEATIDARRTQPVKASCSTEKPNAEECTFGRQILIPFSSRQQFVKIALFKVGRQGDMMLGEATAPIADLRAESISPWPLLRDFEEQGTIYCCVKLPSDDEPAAVEPQTRGNSDGSNRKIRISIETARELVISGSNTSYYVTAYYQGDSQETIDTRRTRPEKARASSEHAQKEECFFGKNIDVPFNSRQQFVKIALYKSDHCGDTLIGEVSVPIADARAESMSSWPIVRDFEEQGSLTFRIQLPSENSSKLGSVQFAQTSVVSYTATSYENNPFSSNAGSDSRTAPPRPPPTTQAPTDPTPRWAPSTSETSFDESPSGAQGGYSYFVASPECADEYSVGDEVQVFSRSAGGWQTGAVACVEGSRVTVDYGARRRIVDLAATPTADGQRLLRKLTSPASTALPSTAPSSRVEAPRVRFEKGSRIEVWSNSRQDWLDGVVEQVFAEDCIADGFSVPAGSLKVRSAAGLKWILPGQESTVRKRSS